MHQGQVPCFDPVNQLVQLGGPEIDVFALLHPYLVRLVVLTSKTSQTDCQTASWIIPYGGGSGSTAFEELVWVNGLGWSRLASDPDRVRLYLEL